MIDPDHGRRRRNEMTRCSLGPSWDTQVKAHERLIARWEKIKMDKDHARRVLEHQKSTPQEIVARFLSGVRYPGPKALMRAQQLIQLLVFSGYAIKPIENDDE